MKIKIKYLIIGFVLCMIIFYLFTLFKCEILTYQHYDEFKQNVIFDDIEFLKILEYKDCDVAKVYYVSKGYSMGTIVTFAYDDGFWKEVSWGDGWSKAGNADNIVYPYFWHWIYFV